MRILGIDPGLNTTGYGVIEASPDRLRLVDAGAVRPSSAQPLAERILQLYEGLAHIIDRTRPDLAVLEACFTHQDYVATAAMMAHARSVVLLLSAQRHLAVVEYAPARVKKALTGNGAASKAQVAQAVTTWLAASVDGPADTTDALALAITHAHIGRADALGLRPTPRTRRRPALPAALQQMIQAAQARAA
jgi:crossover junction endodeoxyribonuclease RuvC